MSQGKSNIARGTFSLLFANAFFSLSSFIIYVVLGRFLLSEQEFGLYGVVIALLSAIALVLVTSVQQAVSKFVSERPGMAAVVKGEAIKMYFALDLLIFFAFVAGADLIALLLNDASLGSLIRLGSLLFLFHPIMSVYHGFLNGLNLYTEQAKLRIFYGIAKIVLIIAFVLLGSGLQGAVIGFVFSSAIAMLYGWRLTRGVLLGQAKASAKKPSSASARINFGFKQLAGFALPIAVFTIIINFLSDFDLFAVKALSPADPDLFAGYYVAAATIARTPAMLVSVITLVLFPLVSKTTFEKDMHRSAFYIRNSVRYTLLFLGPFIAFIAASPSEAISFVFGQRYVPGSAALALLVFAFLFYSVFVTLTTVISASGRPAVSTAFALIALLASIALNLLLVPAYSIAGAAIATLAAMLVAMLLSIAFVLLRFRALVSLKSLLRISVSAAVVFAVSSLFPAHGLFILLKCSVLVLAYAAVLFALGEVKDRDWKLFLSLFKAKSVWAD